MQLDKSLLTYVQAKYSLMAVESVEETRVLGSIRGVAKALGFEVVTWSIASGFRIEGAGGEVEGLEIQDPDTALMWIAEESGGVVKKPGALFVLLDFHPYIEKGMPVNVPIVRRLRELGSRLRTAPAGVMRKAVVMVSPEFSMPEGLLDEVIVLREPLPSADVLERALDSLQRDLPESMQVSGEERARVVAAGCGLTTRGFSDVLARSVIVSKKLDPSVVAEEKEQVVKRSGLIEVLKHNVTFDAIGGLEVLKEWTRLRKLAFTEDARKYGLRRPKGVLCGGPPGTGKSISAYAIAGEFGLPLLRLGEIEDSLVGESQKRLRKALDVAAAIAPCVLFVDEAEKLFAGGSGGSGAATDGGVGAKMLGMWLTWMQENEGVFVIMTSNRVSQLPAELVRKGRLDAQFLMDLPTSAERESIWRVKISAKGRDCDGGAFDIGGLAEASVEMTGAEIESVLEAAMFRAFALGDEISQMHVLRELQQVIPQARSMKGQLDEMRQWCKGKLVPASLPDGNDVEKQEAGRLAGLL